MIRQERTLIAVSFFTDSTIIDIASCTKTFTATAILQQYDKCKLDINDKITKYFELVWIMF